MERFTLIPNLQRSVVSAAWAALVILSQPAAGRRSEGSHPILEGHVGEIRFGQQGEENEKPSVPKCSEGF